jgi:threonine aldolase
MGMILIRIAAEQDFKRLFGDDIEVFFVYSGTGANVLGLQACLHPFEAVICSDMAHIHTDETGAPERNLNVEVDSIEK